jgi:hypothetical protein
MDINNKNNENFIIKNSNDKIKDKEVNNEEIPRSCLAELNNTEKIEKIFEEEKIIHVNKNEKIQKIEKIKKKNEEKNEKKIEEKVEKFEQQFEGDEEKNEEDEEDEEGDEEEEKSNHHTEPNYYFYKNLLKSEPSGDYIDIIHKTWFGKYKLLER